MRSAWSASRGSSNRIRIRGSASCCPRAAASPTRCSIWSPTAERQEGPLTERIEAAAPPSRSDRRHAARRRLRAREFLATLAQDCRDIAGILQTVALIRSASQTVRDLVAGYGEIWSTRLFSAYLRHRGRRPGTVALDRRARHRVGRMGTARTGGALGRVAGERRAHHAARAGDADHHRIHRARRRRACRRRSAATAATSPARSSARCSMPKRSISGPTSTAC